MSVYAKYLNRDVELVVESTGKQVDNIVEMVNQVNLDKDSIKAYLADFASCLKANGKDDNTVKALKSARKAILDFAHGLRKGQEDDKKWSIKNCKAMLNQFATEAGSINALAKACREAVSDEEEPKAWVLEDKLAKLIEKALEEAYTIEDIEKALKKMTAPESLPKAA